MNNLKTIESALQRLEELYDINHEVMDAEDLGDLLTTIDELKFMQYEQERIEYKDQLKSFVDYLESGGNSGDDYEKWSAWVDTDYVITHGDQTVTVHNGADFYDGLYHLLKETLDDTI